MDHVIVRRLEHLTGSRRGPSLGHAVETRERPGPAHKNGAFPHDSVWVQLRGGLFVARAQVKICWIGEYSSVPEVRRRTRGTPLHDVSGFWTGRPRYGYAAVAELAREEWVEPFWAGPRTYGYEWIVLEDHKKKGSWLDAKEPPRGGAELRSSFDTWLASR
ncbi:MAG: hypothetical protein ABR575_01140 [Actinomycetota bacterium]